LGQHYNNGISFVLCNIPLKRELNIQKFPHQASRAFLVSGHAQHGFRGFFSSVPSIAGEASTLAADRPDISTCLIKTKEQGDTLI